MKTTIIPYNILTFTSSSIYLHYLELFFKVNLFEPVSKQGPHTAFILCVSYDDSHFLLFLCYLLFRKTKSFVL